MRTPIAPALVLALATACSPAMAAPFTPASDGEVVERLPAAADPAVRSVESLRKQLAARPNDLDLRLAIARRYFELALAQGDPRYVGYARAALTPAAQAGARDPRYWLVLGLLQQYGHDFEGALQSLSRASELDPDALEPVSWRAAIHMVQARYREAEAECRRLTATAPPLQGRGCFAYVQAATGELLHAYDGLDTMVRTSRERDPGLLLWVHTRLAEMAMRLQRWDEAERHFKAALAQGLTDQFLLAAYADFLIERNRPAEALQLLAGWERSDVLLLRLALAGRATRDPRAAGWAQQLRERLREAARRGDALHEQEAARFALEIDNDPAEALALARSNYEKQKEPRDAEILMRAAEAARQPKAAQPALDWLRESHYEDPRLQALARRLAAGGGTR